jgi:hypothetical protein
MHPDLSDDEVGENKEARMTFSMVGSANIVKKTTHYCGILEIPVT